MVNLNQFTCTEYSYLCLIPTFCFQQFEVHHLSLSPYVHIIGRQHLLPNSPHIFLDHIQRHNYIFFCFPLSILDFTLTLIIT